jgi:F-type H+-transporting ATPase subunit b
MVRTWFLSFSVIFVTALLSSTVSAEDGSGALPQLNPETFATQIFWLFVFFAILYFIISKIALPRISSVIEARHDKIEQDLEKAHTLKEKTETIKAEYEDALAQAHVKISDLMKKTHDEIAKKNMDGHASLSDKLASLSEKAEKTIADQSTKAMGQIQEASTTIAIEISNKLASIAVNDNDVANAIKANLKKESSHGTST